MHVHPKIVLQFTEPRKPYFSNSNMIERRTLDGMTRSEDPD